SNTLLHNAKFSFDVCTIFRESRTLSDDTYKTAFDSRSTLWEAGQSSQFVLHVEQDACRIYEQRLLGMMGKRLSVESASPSCTVLYTLKEKSSAIISDSDAS